ncbi:MAG: hypothetical protein IJ890_04680 [Clostridia bacterium]|nr:hypothetical protein [Clostridia bacterium]
MELLNNINNLDNKILNDLNLNNLQNNFLQTNIGQIANGAIDLGLRYLLPDYVENEIIEVKDALISGGIKEGINKAIENAIEIGKKAIGIESAEFKNIEQAEKSLEQGEIINGISDSLDFVLDKLSSSNIISKNVTNIIKNGKDFILNNFSADIDKEFVEERKAINKIEKYINNWEKNYNNKNLEGLQKEYNKIEKQMKKILPLENIINNVNKIRNINELIKNNENFDFDDVYLELAKKL